MYLGIPEPLLPYIKSRSNIFSHWYCKNSLVKIRSNVQVWSLKRKFVKSRSNVLGPLVMSVQV